MTASGNDIYTSPDRRAELIGRDAAPLAAEAGRVIFSDPDTRVTELPGLILDTNARTRTSQS